MLQKKEWLFSSLEGLLQNPAFNVYTAFCCYETPAKWRWFVYFVDSRSFRPNYYPYQINLDQVFDVEQTDVERCVILTYRRYNILAVLTKRTSAIKFFLQPMICGLKFYMAPGLWYQKPRATKIASRLSGYAQTLYHPDAVISREECENKDTGSVKQIIPQMRDGIDIINLSNGKKGRDQ